MKEKKKRKRRKRTKASPSTPWFPSMRIMMSSPGLTWVEKSEKFLCEAAFSLYEQTWKVVISLLKT